MEEVKMGAKVILVGNTFQRGNQYGNENIPGNATMTSISGTAYTTNPQNYAINEVQNYLKNYQYILFQKDQLNRNAFDKRSTVEEMYDRNLNVKLFNFDEVYEKDGQLIVKKNLNQNQES